MAEAVATDRALIDGRPSDAAITAQLLRPVLQGFRGFWPLLIVTGLGSAGLLVLMLYTMLTGVGLWGNNIPVAWAFAIINFVWWIGIGHAGTFISAVMLVLNQKSRNSINRFAEAMTLFAIINAGLFPILHLGRPWFAYWLVPYPSTMGVWPQFKSSLPVDVAAITTYGTASFLFWYMGLLPDLASARDRVKPVWARRIYGFFALGWRGSARHWSHYRTTYGIIGGIATALVISVHSVVSMDFATAQLPGWHSTIFPPYFVAGAIHSGFAMVLTLLVPARPWLGVKNVITQKHIDVMAKLMLLTGWLVGGSYAIESFNAWYSGDTFERYMYLEYRPFGPYAWMFWAAVGCNWLAVQPLWFKKVRERAWAVWVVALFVTFGMWDERFMLIVTSEARDFLPSSWHHYTPTWVDLGILFGTISFFLFNFLLFLRLVPFVPIAEVKELNHHLKGQDEEAERAHAEVGHA